MLSRYLLTINTLLIINLASSSNYCNHKKPSNNSLALLKTFCSKQNGTLQGSYERECHAMNENNNSIIGIDMSNCSLTEIKFNTQNDKSKLQWVAINGNDMVLNHTINQLRSAKDLSVILIDKDDICVHFAVNITLDKVRKCTDPLSACITGKECLPHSTCTKDGPGLFACPCQRDWQSYKCLKQKGFPYLPWITSICAGTIVLCVIIRLLQRNDRKLGKEKRTSLQTL